MNLGRVADHFEDGASVDRSHLVSAGLIPDKPGRVKLLSSGEITKALHFKGIDASVAAKEKVEASGGTITASV